MKPIFYVCDVCGYNHIEYDEKEYEKLIVHYGETHVCTGCEENYKKLKEIKEKQ